MNSSHVLLVLAAMMAVTFVLRSLPFVAAQFLMKHPVVQRLRDFLPLSIMSLLVVHSGVGAAAENPLGPGPVLAAVAVTVVMQWRLKQPLLSILAGTALFVVSFYVSI